MTRAMKLKRMRRLEVNTKLLSEKTDTLDTLDTRRGRWNDNIKSAISEILCDAVN